MYSPNIPRCQYIKVNGTQCGSPAMRRNRFCFFHKRWHEQRIVLNSTRKRPSKPALDLPVLEDANSVQVALMQVMRLLLSGQVEHKTASLLLYGLQTASANLRKVKFEPLMKEEVVIDPRAVDQSVLGERLWSNDDWLEGESEEEAAAATDQSSATLDIKAVAAVPVQYIADNSNEFEAESDDPTERASTSATERRIPFLSAVATVHTTGGTRRGDARRYVQACEHANARSWMLDIG